MCPTGGPVSETEDPGLPFLGFLGTRQTQNSVPYQQMPLCLALAASVRSLAWPSESWVAATPPLPPGLGAQASEAGACPPRAAEVSDCSLQWALVPIAITQALLLLQPLCHPGRCLHYNGGPRCPPVRRAGGSAARCLCWSLGPSRQEEAATSPCYSQVYPALTTPLQAGPHQRLLRGGGTAARMGGGRVPSGQPWASICSSEGQGWAG